MDLTLKINERDFEKLRREFRLIPGGMEKATAAALNKTVPGMRTDAVREIRAVYHINAGDARKTMTIRKASRSRLEAALVSQGGAIPLFKFKVSPNKSTGRRPAGGVRVTVRKGEGGRIGHGFIAQMRSGHKGVFVRKGKGRFPIDEKFGPAVPSMLKDEGAFERIQESADARLSKNIDHEIHRILMGYGK